MDGGMTGRSRGEDKRNTGPRGSEKDGWWN